MHKNTNFANQSLSLRTNKENNITLLRRPQFQRSHSSRLMHLLQDLDNHPLNRTFWPLNQRHSAKSSIVQHWMRNRYKEDRPETSVGFDGLFSGMGVPLHKRGTAHNAVSIEPPQPCGNYKTHYLSKYLVQEYPSSLQPPTRSPIYQSMQDERETSWDSNKKLFQAGKGSNILEGG